MTLPILVVETAHSRYEIDQNAGSYRRTRVHPDASDFTVAGFRDGQDVYYRDLLLEGLKPGGQVRIINVDGTYVRSTVIQSVTEVPADATAKESAATDDEVAA